MLGSTVDACSSVAALCRCLFQFIVRVVDTALISRDRYAQCQTVRGRRLPCHGAEDVSLGPVQQTAEISQLQPWRRWVTSLGPCSMSSSSLSLVAVVPQIQFNDRVVDFPVVVVQVQQVRGDRRDPTVASPFLGLGRSHARCVQRQMPIVDVLAQFIDGCHVPVIMQRRLLSGSAPVSVFAGDSGHSSCATEMGT